MRRIKWIYLVTIMILLSCTGCVAQHSIRDLAVCGSYAVPGMFCFDLKGGTYDCEILEEDSQGRILYLYTTEHYVTEEDETAVVICQAIKSDYAYFYEDICWMIGEYTEDDLAALKEQNDWEEELDFDKMSKRNKNATFDGFILIENELEYEPLKKACCKQIDIQEEWIIGMPTLDKNPKGCELCILMIKNDDGGEEKYYILANPEYEIAYMDAGDEPVDVDTLVAFKKAFGWYDEQE